MLKTREKKQLDIITTLTEDHELQSELWILMSEEPSMSPNEALEEVIRKAKADVMIFKAVSGLLNVQPQKHTIALLDSLEPIERSTVTMMMFGIDADLIREYNSLSLIRHNQVVTALVSSKAWETFLEEEARFRAKTRSGSEPDKNS